ncbi:S-layer homology domain-containing protein [Shewanella sp. A32]|uniref:S-layer homology domain-containing protein n=1 Tax=Shewanella sp. A32 TaxID=3031327 RepID=UPI0023B914D8|nr:S-layer homology domain-containing protein [Shewanella sp. A32]MDF0532914.1 S-layer homology domain-containing protein [Shewanella sp. A32]
MPLLLGGCSSTGHNHKSNCGGTQKGMSTGGHGGGPAGGPGGIGGGPGGDMGGGPGGGMGGGPGGKGRMPPGGAGNCDITEGEMDKNALPAQQHSKYFKDLNDRTADINAYADALKEKGLLPGYQGEYHHYLALTRGELAAMLYAFYRYPNSSAAYDDVKPDIFYYQATLHGRAAKVFKDTFSFNPDTQVTRQDVALWMYKSELLAGMPTDSISEDLSSVSDAANITLGYEKAVATMLKLGVMRTDYDGNFNPQEAFSRAEFAPIFYRLVTRNEAPTDFKGRPPRPDGSRVRDGHQPDQFGEPPKDLPSPELNNGFAPMPERPVDHGGYANTLTADVNHSSYRSSADNQNALRVTGKVHPTLTDITVFKTAGKPVTEDAANFYGANAAVLALNGADVTLVRGNIQSKASGGNGIFAYGTSTKIHVNNTYIRTTSDNAGGVMVAGGAEVYVQGADIDTQGRASAALRSDRGGGKLTVNGGQYMAQGEGSPAIYSTADIIVNDAKLTATTSEAVVVEGSNSVQLNGSVVSGNMQRKGAQNLQNVMLYQSMSGDAQQGTGRFTMTGGALTANNGDMFYVTNTHAKVTLQQVMLNLANSVLLKVAGNDARNGWGHLGKNGGHCEFTAIDQQLEGKILVDNSSSLQLSLEGNSMLTGSINADGTNAEVAMILSPTSHWQLTADSYLSNFKGNLANVDAHGFKLYVNGEQLK